MAGYNLPDGVTESDSRAPWNQPNAEDGRTCGDCAHCILLGIGSDGLGVCIYDAVTYREDTVDVVNASDEACPGIAVRS